MYSMNKATRISNLLIRNYAQKHRSTRQPPIICTAAAFSSNTGTNNELQRDRNKNKGTRLKRDRSFKENGMKRQTERSLSDNKKITINANKLETNSTLSKCNDIMAKLLQRRQELPLPPIEWLSSGSEFVDEADMQKREELYKDALSLIQAIELSIKANRIQASSGQDIRDLTALLGNILLICSESTPKRIAMNDCPKTSQSCSRVLSLFVSLNLDIHNFHNFCTIRAANQEHEWELASSLFCKQIDPDFNGLVPVDSELGWNGFLEMGLYGLAMNLSNRGYEGVRVVEGVLDAVRDMCMVSPTDQEKYMMAAGSALGRAGQWQGCVDYILDNSDSSELGQPLFAAVMSACYICEKYDAVLDVYYKMQQGSDSTRSDWQWEGGYARSHPLCMDLLLRSVGMRLLNIDDRNQGFGEATVLIFNQIIEEGGRISLDAIRGVLRACENDGDYERAIQVLKILQTYEGSKSDWKIVHGSDNNFLYASEEASIVTQAIDDDVLATVMDTCCSAGEFGLAILCLRTTNSIGYHQSNSTNVDSDIGFMVENLIAQQPMLHDSNRLLESTVVALTNLQCSKDAMKLYSRCTDNQGRSLGKDLPLPLSNRIHVNSAWREAYHHMDRLLYAADAIRSSNYKMSQEDRYNLSLGTALMIKCATKAGQVNAGLEVANAVLASISQQKNSKKSIKDTMKSFFGLKEESNEKDEVFWFLSDELFASIIAARRAKYGINDAHDFYFNGMSAIIAKDRTREWVESTNLALDLMVELGDIDRAEDFFKSIDKKTRTPDTYAIMANGYKLGERWGKIAACYRAAKKDSLLSERLCFLAMQEIAKSETSSKIKILRSVTDDVAALKGGVKSGAWIADNYWTLKRLLGYHHARLLMWWNNPNETQKFEFRLAAQHMNERKKKGLASEIDALTALIQLANGHALDNVEPAFAKEFHFPSLVAQALIEICGSGCDEEKQLLVEGVSFLSRTKSKDLCKEFAEHIESHGIIVDDEILFLVRTAGDVRPPSSQQW